MAKKEHKPFSLADTLAGVPNLGTDTQGREQIEYIDIDHIHPDERNFYALDGIEELAANIEFTGLQQPLRVRPNPDHEGEYIISSGHRRHAALRQLVDGGEDKFRLVPSIVERDAGADGEAAPLLQELRLIYANSDTRKMSSSDVSKQAERVEMLLYRLKEAGVEFPGRMRDHVAEACKVSKSKLSRLKVIRENLAPDIKKLWEKGKLKESAAYAFAQNDPDVQMMAFAQLKANKYNDDPKWWYEHEVKNWADRIKKENKLKCVHGHCDKCENSEKRLSRMAGGQWGDHCREGKCCHGCPNLATCKSACLQLPDEISAARAKRKEQKAKDKAQQEERDRPEVEQITELWIRFAEARTIAGKSMEEYIEAAGIYADEATKKRWPEQEKGKRITRDSGLPYSGGRGTSLWDVLRLRKVADVLGCSLDYLLCRTDDPNPVPASGTAPTWQTGTPPEAGTYVCKVISNGWVGSFDIVKWDDQRGKWRLDLAGYDEGDGARVDHWFPLPPTDEEAAPDEQ